MAIDFLGVNPITALVVTALVVTAVINGLLAAPLLVLAMRVSNNREVMGERTNGRRLNVLGWGTTVVMAIAAIALVVITVAGSEPVPRRSTSSTGSSAPRPSEPRT